MPQIFQVLRCYKCAVFQIHQTRKDNKWVCKICCEKQSVKRHYGIGTGKDCRLHVQRLNVMRCENEKIKTYNSEDSDTDHIVEESSIIDNERSKQIESKWTIYADKQEENVIEEAEFLNDSEVVLEVPQKRKTKGKNVRQIKHFKALNNSCNYVKSNININTDSTEINVLDPIINIHQNDKANCFNTIDDSNNVIQKPQFETSNSNYQKIKNTSKWAQYVQDDEEENTDENNIKNCHKNTLFLMCDDSDLDNILDY